MAFLSRLVALFGSGQEIAAPMPCREPDGAFLGMRPRRPSIPDLIRNERLNQRGGWEWTPSVFGEWHGPLTPWFVKTFPKRKNLPGDGAVSVRHADSQAGFGDITWRAWEQPRSGPRTLVPATRCPTAGCRAARRCRLARRRTNRARARLHRILYGSVCPEWSDPARLGYDPGRRLE